jgi:ubiquinol oxidase
MECGARAAGPAARTARERGRVLCLSSLLMHGTTTEHERLVETLCDENALADYKRPFDGYQPGLLPSLLGGFLVFCGNIIYGARPSYLKFRAVEVIARVPYHSWSSAIFTLLTLFYSNEARALRLSSMERFMRLATDNETMHVIVISHLVKKEQPAGIIRHTIIPLVFALFYFWIGYILYLLNPRWSLETNYLFEQHAFEQYDQFLKENEETLKAKPISSEFLAWYGRNPRSQYEFFRSVRNDELIHRNQSIREISFNEHRGNV